jgi:CelD/BcsL family acetyltransferase involved in cellulose biosynthesis
MQVIPITTSDGLNGLRAEWSALAGDVPMMSWQWLANWWRHYGQSRELQQGRAQLSVLCVRDDQKRLVGLAPWYSKSSKIYGRVLQFLGNGEVCTDHLTLPCAQGREAAVAQALAQWLAPDQPPGCSEAAGLLPADRSQARSRERWGLLDLTGIDEEDRSIGLLLNALRERRAIVHVRPGTNCWHLNLPESWDEYLALLSKCQRKHVRRLQRTYFDTGRAVLRFVESEQALEGAFNVLARLHRLRWQSRGEPGVFDAPTFVAFHREIAQQFCADGRLRLSWLELDGQPIAAEYQFVGDGTLYAYQSGMDPAAVEHQPGNLSMMAIVRWAIEQGHRGIDLLRGDEPYKAHWRAEPQSTIRIRVLPGKWTGWLRHNLWVTARQTKTILSKVGMPRRAETVADRAHVS